MSDHDLIRRGDALKAIQLGDTVTKLQARIASVPAVDADPVCTDCGGSGITYQTERRCACQTYIPAVQPTVSPEQPVATTDVAALVETLDRCDGGWRSEYSRVGHHLNEASWHVHLAGFKCRGDAEAFLTAALARVKGVM